MLRYAADEVLGQHVTRLYPDLDPTDKQTKYWAMVACLDEAIGELLGTLQELGLERRTLVLFFSDNGGSGPGDNRPLRGGKSAPDRHQRG